MLTTRPRVKFCELPLRCIPNLREYRIARNLGGCWGVQPRTRDTPVEGVLTIEPQAHPALTASDPAGAARELRALLSSLPALGAATSFPQSAAPEQVELPGAGRLWESFGVIRQVVDGSAEEVATAFRANAAEAVDAQLEGASAGIQFQVTGRGAVATVDIDIHFPNATYIRRRRRWLFVRLTEGSYRLWMLGTEGCPYVSPADTFALREQAKSLRREEWLRVLVSTKGFAQACNLIPERARDFLAAVLQDPTCEPGFRLSAVRALEFLPRTLAIGVLETLAYHPDPEVRRTSLGVFWSIDPEDAIGPMIDLVSETSWDAVDFFLHLKGASQALPLIAERGDVQAFRSCLNHLIHANCYDLAVPGLLAAIHSGPPELREEAFSELCFLGDWRVRALLIGQLQDAAEESRAQLLGRPFRSSARGSRDHVVALIREEASRQLHMAYHSSWAAGGSAPALNASDGLWLCARRSRFPNRQGDDPRDAGVSRGRGRLPLLGG